MIRAKGICYFTQDPDMSYMFEQAGRQKQLKEAGQWYMWRRSSRIWISVSTAGLRFTAYNLFVTGKQ